MAKSLGRFRQLVSVMEGYEVDEAIDESRALNSTDPDDVLKTSDALKEQEEKLEQSKPDEDASDDASVQEDSQEPTDSGSESPAEPLSDADNSESEAGVDSFDKEEESVAVESLYKDLERAKKAAKALEQIADILEASEETGILSENSAPVIDVAVGSIYNDLGVGATPMTNVSTESMQSFSGRFKIARETLQDIKNKIISIWKAIIAYFSKIFKFVKEVVQHSEVKENQNIDKLIKLRKVYKDNEEKIKAVTKAKEILGPGFSSLTLSENETSGADIVKAADLTVSICTDFIDDLNKNVKSSKESLVAAKGLVSDLETAVISTFKPEKEDEQKLSDELVKIVRADFITKEPRVCQYAGGSRNSEVFTFVSKVIAGGYKFSYSKPKKKDFDVAELDLLKFVLIEDKDHRDKVKSVFTLLDSDFNGFFDSIQKSMDLQKRMGVSIVKFVDEFEKFIEDIKFIDGIKTEDEFSIALKNMKNLKRFIETVNRFYVKSSVTTERYLNSYIDMMISYSSNSLKSYL